MKQDRTAEKLKLLVEACFEKKARDVVSLEVTDLLGVADHFLLATVDSAPQARALAAHLEERAKAAGFRLYHTEGEAAGVWVLSDFGDVVVHLFQPEARAFYDLEGLWFQAARTDHAEGRPPVTKPGKGAREKSPGEGRAKPKAAAKKPPRAGRKGEADLAGPKSPRRRAAPAAGGRRKA